MSSTVRTRKVVELLKPEVTHVMFGNGGVICPVHEVFKVVSKLHQAPSHFLLDGWQKTARMRYPEHCAPWLDVTSFWWIMRSMVDTRTGLRWLEAGNASPFTVVREVMK